MPCEKPKITFDREFYFWIDSFPKFLLLLIIVNSLYSYRYSFQYFIEKREINKILLVDI